MATEFDETIRVLLKTRRAAAWQAASTYPGLRLHTGTTVETVECDATSARAHLDDGRTLDATLLVAADSRFSQIRRAIGIATHMHDFGKTMLLRRIKHTESNLGTSWERFGHQQTRALLTLDGHLSSAILTVPDTEAQALKQLSSEALAAEIAARYEGRLGEVTLVSTVHCYPLIATWARRFVGQRFAVAGDAASTPRTGGKPGRRKRTAEFNTAPHAHCHQHIAAAPELAATAADSVSWYNSMAVNCFMRRLPILRSASATKSSHAPPAPHRSGEMVAGSRPC